MILSPKSRKNGVNAINNLYQRIELHEQAIKYGFIFKMVPVALAAAILLFLAVRDYSNGETQYAIMEMLTAILVFIIIYLFWKNDVLRTAIVHMS